MATAFSDYARHIGAVSAYVSQLQETGPAGDHEQDGKQQVDFQVIRPPGATPPTGRAGNGQRIAQRASTAAGAVGRDEGGQDATSGRCRCRRRSARSRPRSRSQQAREMAERTDPHRRQRLVQAHHQRAVTRFFDPAPPGAGAGSRVGHGAAGEPAKEDGCATPWPVSSRGDTLQEGLAWMRCCR